MLTTDIFDDTLASPMQSHLTDLDPLGQVEWLNNKDL